MPAASSVITTFPVPIPLDLDRAIDRAIATVPDDRRGEATLTASLRGVEASVGYRPTSWLSTGGYATRLWGGGWEAGARVRVAWGRR